MTDSRYPISLPTGSGPTALHRVIHDGASWPARPTGVAAGMVDWVGPTEPPDWLDGDTWIETA